MREEYLFEVLGKRRQFLLNLVKELGAEQQNQIPEGFNNNLHWHLGHILTITDSMIFGLSETGSRLKPDYKFFFGNGTKPVEWTTDVPSWNTVISGLKEQIQDYHTLLTGKLDEPVKENTRNAITIEEMVLYSMIHESVHVGNVSYMIRLLK